MNISESITLLRADDRFHSDLGWLNSWHTFSFARHFDPNRLGFRSLRVINDDRVTGGQGFGTHPHENMEIFSYVLSGSLAHKDSMGNGRELQRGDMQLMSAGTGIFHSEFNPNPDDPTHFLQIWIEPNVNGLQPSYQEKHFSDDDKKGRWATMLSPDGRDGSLTIHQDATVSAAILGRDDEVTVEVPIGRYGFVHMADGHIQADGRDLVAGDSLQIVGPARLTLTGVDSGEVIFFDLA